MICLPGLCRESRQRLQTCFEQDQPIVGRKIE